MIVQHCFPTLETVIAEPHPSHFALLRRVIPQMEYEELSFAHRVPGVGAKRDSTIVKIRDNRPFGTSLIDSTASDFAVPWGFYKPGYRLERRDSAEYIPIPWLRVCAGQGTFVL